MLNGELGDFGTYSDVIHGNNKRKHLGLSVEINTSDSTLDRHFFGKEGQNIGIRACLGQWDPVAKEGVIAQWINSLPQLEEHVRIFDGVGHFVEEVKFDEIADAIIDVAGIK